MCCNGHVMVNLINDLELENDINYVKSVLKNCSSSYLTAKNNISSAKKIMSKRINFIKSQFKNIFNSNNWY